MTELFKRLMEKRGLSEDFLSPKYEDLSDPFELPEMERAVERMKLAADRNEKVIVYGDYDVDGVTASAEMVEILNLIGVRRISVVLPDRFEDGYGMNMKIIEQAKWMKAGLVVTVDCGSNNAEVITELSRNGADVVVTDHHEIAGGLPKAHESRQAGEPGGFIAVVNPKREDFRMQILARQAEICGAIEEHENEMLGKKKDISGLSELCGAGVVFMVAKACVKKGWIKDGREKWLLDLAMIGTVCDSMNLTKDNRIICHYGMIVLQKGARIGLKELQRVAKVKKLDTEAIGFQIGPRLNAAGRMANASVALRLIQTKSEVMAAKIAKQLDELNKQRQEQQEEATREVAERGIGEDRVIVVEGDWHEGVLGIIAGRLVETYQRPCFVLSSKNGKGSGRSFGEFNLALALSECQDLLEKGGGHAEACGVKVKEGKVEAFRKRLNKYYDSLKLREQERFLLQRADLTLKKIGELTLDFMEEMEKLEPFGMGNPEPVFLVEGATVLETRRMGSKSNHLRIMIQDKDGMVFKLVKFFAPEEWFETELGSAVNVWLTSVVNTWRNETNVEGRIVRLERAEEEV